MLIIPAHTCSPKDDIEKIIKVSLYGLFQSLDLRGETGGGREVRTPGTSEVRRWLQGCCRTLPLFYCCGTLQFRVGG